jgi:succinylarginine dihydrolase
VYGRSASGRPTPQPPPKLYPARQTLEASEAVARLHQLDPARTVFAQQNPAVIDEGVFHNDVIAVGHEQVLLYHERAFAEGERAVQHLSQALGGRLIPVRIDADELSVSDAVGSYLFNAMLVTAGAGRLALIAPLEAQECAPANDAIQRIISEDGNPIAEVHFLDVRQSMANGGGPACLRLRVRLTEAERAAAHGPCLLDAAKIQGLERWVRTHYREVLRPEDLRDPVLVTEVRTALDALTELLALGSDFYPFQRTGG